jgi:hypothetical protein
VEAPPEQTTSALVILFDLQTENVMTRTSIFMLSALAGAMGLFVAARRQSKRAGAIKDMVERRDWESAPIKPAARGEKIPSPEKVAEEVTGIPNAISEVLAK